MIAWLVARFRVDCICDARSKQCQALDVHTPLHVLR